MKSHSCIWLGGVESLKYSYAISILQQQYWCTLSKFGFLYINVIAIMQINIEDNIEFFICAGIVLVLK